ncbi:serine/threonine protein kinase [Candidatus Bipolaricaulota bacterium]
MIDYKPSDYEPEDEPHQGNMGSVQILKSKTGDHRVAEKQLKPFVLPAVLENEAKKQSEICSPFVVRIHSLDIGKMAIIMEYCSEGLDEALRETLLERHTWMELPRCLEVLCQIAHGLHVAHNAEIVHGDIKPANVRFGSDKFAKLSDFGAAKHLRIPEAIVAPGSSSYMAREILEGEEVTPETDWFSFGILAFLVLSGQHPFYSPDRTCLTTPANYIRDLAFKVPELRNLRPDIPYSVGTLIHELLERENKDRESTARRLRAVLSKFLSVPELTIAPLNLPSPSTKLMDESWRLSRNLKDSYMNLGNLRPLSNSSLASWIPCLVHQILNSKHSWSPIAGARRDSLNYCYADMRNQKLPL